MIAPRRAIFALSLALAAFIVGRDGRRVISGKMLFVTGGQDFSRYHLLPFRKKVELVGKKAALLQEPGQQFRIIECCSTLMVVPDHRTVSFNVPLDRKAGQRIGEIATDPHQ